MGGATPKAKFNFNYNIFCCDFSPKSILLTNFLFTICLCAGMHTHTQAHTWILYYILIDSHAYRECILINRAQTQRSVPAPIGRHLAALQSSYRLFFLPPSLPLHLPLPASLYLCRLHSCSHLFIYSLLPPSASHFQFFACKLEKFKRKIQCTLPKAASKWRLADPQVFHLRGYSRPDTGDGQTGIGGRRLKGGVHATHMQQLKSYR